MKVLNRVIAGILSLAFVAISVIGIIYITGRLLEIRQFTLFVEQWYFALLELPAPQLQAILGAIFVVALLLFLLQIVPRHRDEMKIKEQAGGITTVSLSDIETLSTKNIVASQDINSGKVELDGKKGRLRFKANIVTPSWLDQNEVRRQVADKILETTDGIGLSERIEHINLRVFHPKRASGS